MPELARRLPKQGFADSFNRLPLLAVRIDHGDSELANGLADTLVASSDRLLPTLGFETEIADRPAWLRGPLGSHLPQTPMDTPAWLHSVLVQGPHFILPLRKRRDTGSPYEERITVGRARNSDVVLRHGSVLKFHAWFECDEDERYFLTDGRSRNGTLVNGTRLGPGGAREVPRGSEVRFAAIVAVLTSPDSLWKAFAAYRPPSPSQNGL